MMKTDHKGFTLIELMIVIAIIGILAAIAVPQYQQFTRKAKFAEVVIATTPFKIGVEVCVVQQGIAPSTAITGCTSGANGMPTNTTTSSQYVASVAANASGNGVIVAQSTASVGVVTDYTLTPAMGTASGIQLVIWTKTGGCISLGLC